MVVVTNDINEVAGPDDSGPFVLCIHLRTFESLRFRFGSNRSMQS